MQQEQIIYHDGAQKLIGQLLYKSSETNQPAIIVFHAIEGPADFTLYYAKKIAECGYVVFVADMYGDARTASTMKEGFALVTPFLSDRGLVRRRAELAYQAFVHQLYVDPARIGVIGFCFGGMCMLELLRSGAPIWAAVGMHSALQKSELPTHDIDAHILMFHGYRDPQVPPTELQPFAEELDAAGVKDWTFTYFGHAKHSFTDPATGTFDPAWEKELGRAYDPVAAHRAFAGAMQFFGECLRK